MRIRAVAEKMNMMELVLARATKLLMASNNSPFRGKLIQSHDNAYRQKKSASSEKGRGADISNCVCKKQVLSRLEGILHNPNW